MVAPTRAVVDQRELVERAGRGDHDAFAVLAGASVARLEAVARLILRDRELAQDAIQEVMVKAWRDLPGLRDPDRFDAWLYRLTVNACVDAVRHRRRRIIEVDLGTFDPAGATDVAASVADRDLLERGFRHLGVDQRAILVLHYYIGLPMPAMAEALGIPLGTAQSRLHRALTALRAGLAADARTPSHVREGQIA
jgi:RNA polymerase sigma-70 factor, ECF subfamily